MKKGGVVKPPAKKNLRNWCAFDKGSREPEWHDTKTTRFIVGVKRGWGPRHGKTPTCWKWYELQKNSRKKKRPQNWVALASMVIKRTVGGRLSENQSQLPEAGRGRREQRDPQQGARWGQK